MNRFCVMTSVLLLFALTGPAGANVQMQECYPAPSKHKDWRIGIIYLHGKFMATGVDQSGFRSLEFQSRKRLLEYSHKHKIRIAIPIAPVSGSGMRLWNSSTLAQIEKDAMRACGGIKLAKKRALIGFSNGGYKARHIAAQSCEETLNYTVIFIRGAQSLADSPNPRHCTGREIVFENDHELWNLNTLAEHLATFDASPVVRVRSANSQAPDAGG